MSARYPLLSVAIVSASLLPALGAAIAQPNLSASERAQRLTRMEEGLSSLDANTRLGTFEGVMQDGTIAERQRAFALAFSSDDKVMRGVALRYRICQSRQIVLQYNVPANYGPSGYVRFRNFNFLNGVTNLAVQSCEPDSGAVSFTLQSNVSALGRQVGGTGTVGGTGFELSFEYRELNWRTGMAVYCEGSFSLDQGGDLSGRLACREPGETFGPVAAIIRLS